MFCLKVKNVWEEEKSMCIYVYVFGFGCSIVEQISFSSVIPIFGTELLFGWGNLLFGHINTKKDNIKRGKGNV